MTAAVLGLAFLGLGLALGYAAFDPPRPTGRVYRPPPPFDPARAVRQLTLDAAVACRAEHVHPDWHIQIEWIAQLGRWRVRVNGGRARHYERLEEAERALLAQIGVIPGITSCV